jgi:hypothetical protein
MRKGLKLATKAALLDAGGAAALVFNKLVRVKESALSFCSSPNEEHADRFVGLDVALDLDFCVGEPRHARALAAAQGYDLVPIKPERISGAFGHSDISQFAREFSEAHVAMSAALDDGMVCPKDRAAMLRELEGVERIARIVRAKLEAGE